jgi:replicative DNA helicase
MEDRRSKYRKKPVKNENLKIDIKFDITELDLMCSYIVSENRSIRRGHIINMRNLFLIIDKSQYGNDKERLDRIDFIMRGIEARLEYNIISSDMILSHIFGGFGGDRHNMVTRELTNYEVEWVNRAISETLKYSIIYDDVDEGLSLLTKFKATDYADRGDVVKEIEEWVKKINNKFRKARANKADDLMFSLAGDIYEEAVRETHRQYSSTSNKLSFGIQALNALTGGGAECGRVYTILGLPGEGKSSTLLDMALQIKKYNKNYVCKDPTKKPCVLLLVMENGVKESVQRIFNMCTGKDMLKYTEDEVVEMLKSEGGLSVSDDNPINIIIKYRPNLSEDTSYLYTLTEDLEDDGYEVICVLQDYLKRIRSVEGSFNGDLRMQLGAIVNEFKIFATLKDIPVITASQLNRVATSSIDEARLNNKSDLVRLIGRSNVGESNLIIENSDWIGLIAPEYDKEFNKYLGIQMVKSRYYIGSDFTVAYMPYLNNTLKLTEDIDSAPAHKLTMCEESKMKYDPNSAQGIAPPILDIKEIEKEKMLERQQKEGNSDEEIFSNGTFLKSNLVINKVHKKQMCRIVQNKLQIAV